MTRNRRLGKIRTIAARDGGCRCAYCTKPLKLKKATLDHVVPVAAGGTNRNDNLKLACWHCNQLKADKPPHVWYGLLMQGLVA